ncbi:hypothetical protein MP228_000102 [Amoeboaphelidium protococcarum]|nr:hypothetical protein MP228_000102 [Amoeboaphelidium protococcarum]
MISEGAAKHLNLRGVEVEGVLRQNPYQISQISPTQYRVLKRDTRQPYQVQSEDNHQQAERLRFKAALMPEMEGPPPQRADVAGWNQYSDDDEDEADELLRATRRRSGTRQDEIEEIGDE